MGPPRNSRGGGLIRFLVLVVLFFMFIGPLLRCAQQLPQMAANTAARAGSGAASAAGGALSNLGRSLLDRIESWWAAQSPAEKFNRVCENLPVEGVDKLCPYFTAAVQGASDAAAAQTACYLAAAGNGTQGQQTLQQIHAICPQMPGDVSGFQNCVQGYVQQHVESGDWSSCLATAPQQLWRELQTMTKPIACPPGLPESLCTTQSSSASAPTPNTSPATRTDVSYLNCLQHYYLAPGVQAVLGTSCGTSVSASNAGCVTGLLQTFTYAGQNLGQQYITYCAAQPQ